MWYHQFDKKTGRFIATTKSKRPVEASDRYVVEDESALGRGYNLLKGNKLQRIERISIRDTEGYEISFTEKVDTKVESLEVREGKVQITKETETGTTHLTIKD